MQQYLYTMVSEFHEKHRHPVCDYRTPYGMPEERRLYRAEWMLEEFCKFFESHDITGQYDALIDLAYYATGTLVEFGKVPVFPVSPAPLIIPGALRGHAKLTAPEVRAIRRFVLTFIAADHQGAQISAIERLLEEVFALCQHRIGLQVLPGFEIVHARNMTKPVGAKRDDSKVQKGAAFEEPDAMLSAEIQRQYQEAIFRHGNHSTSSRDL